MEQTLEVITGKSVNGMPNVYIGGTIEDVEAFVKAPDDLCELVRLKPPSPPSMPAPPVLPSPPLRPADAPMHPAPVLCADDCQFSQDGVCDDGCNANDPACVAAVTFAYCPLGSDCADCGHRTLNPRPPPPDAPSPPASPPDALLPTPYGCVPSEPGCVIGQGYSPPSALPLAPPGGYSPLPPLPPAPPGGYSPPPPLPPAPVGCVPGAPGCIGASPPLPLPPKPQRPPYIEFTVEMSPVEEATSLPPLRRLLKSSAEMWTDVQLQRQLQSQATLRLSDLARAVTNTLEGISAASIQALVTPNLAYESASEWEDVLQLIPVNITVRVNGDCGSSFIPQMAPNNRSQWEQAFSSNLQLPSRITVPPPCFNESSTSQLAALEAAGEEAVVVLDACLTGSLADVMSATIATSLVVSLSVSAVASTASSVVVSIASSNVASTPVLAAGK